MSDHRFQHLIDIAEAAIVAAEVYREEAATPEGLEVVENAIKQLQDTVKVIKNL